MKKEDKVKLIKNAFSNSNHFIKSEMVEKILGMSCEVDFLKNDMILNMWEKQTEVYIIFSGIARSYYLDKDALKAMIRDKTSGGSSVPLKFINTYMTYAPDIEPENFDVCPILLTQPNKDRWTPLHLSTPFLNKIKKVPVNIVELENGGHYPIEPLALNQLHSNILKFLNKYL